MKARIGYQVVDLEGSILGEVLAGNANPDLEVWVALVLGQAPGRIEVIE